MPDLLIRGVDEETKRAIAVQAAQNGRSMQGQLLRIVNAAAVSYAFVALDGLDEACVETLEERAQANSRSVVEEATMILKEALSQPEESLFDLLSRAGEALEGTSLELPERHLPRSANRGE